MSALGVLAKCGFIPTQATVGLSRVISRTMTWPLSTRFATRIVSQVNEPVSIEVMLWQSLRSASFRDA